MLAADFPKGLGVPLFSWKLWQKRRNLSFHGRAVDLASTLWYAEGEIPPFLFFLTPKTCGGLMTGGI